MQIIMHTIIILLLFFDPVNCNKDIANVTRSNPNATSAEISIKNSLDLSRNPHLLFVLFASLSGCVWLLYITFFNARFIGFIVTKIINRLVIKKGDAYFKIGMY